MARTLLTTNDIGRAGTILTPLAQSVAAADGAKFRNTGREWIRIGNTSGGNCTMTVQTPQLVDGNAIAPKTYTIATATYPIIPPFPVVPYNNTDEMVYLDFTTAVTVVIFRDGT